MSPQEFVDKWRRSKLKESAGSQSHFNDLCHMLGHPTPAKADPEGASFTFEKGASKLGGGEGWADVWKKGCFAWEYKGKHKDLDVAYQQLQLYRDALLNPPLLIVSDMERIVVRTNFTNNVQRTFELRLDDLATPEGLAILRAAFENPDKLRADETPIGVTQQAATEFSRLAESLRTSGHDSEKAAHFLIRILFCLFAEDIGLLPDSLFTRLIDATKDDPSRFGRMLEQLFGHMADGGYFDLHRIPHFNGGIFDSTDTLPLTRDDLDILARVAALDWSSIEPSILGTLFERGLDPGKRAQLGAHYTSRDDILLIVEPVLMRPLRRRWEDVQKEADELHAKWRAADSAGGARTRARNRLQKLLHGFADVIADTRVLDPACGSGNFLYVALRQLLDLEKEVIALSADLGLGLSFPTVTPEQLFGIEINEYAHELAQATIWIGYIQWLRENGFGQPTEPILKALDNIKHMDAILAFDEDGDPVEPEWPEADVAIGNPPFLGNKRMRSELGDKYVDALRDMYGDAASGMSDLCCYWFAKAGRQLSAAGLRRAGLLATQSIRAPGSRAILESIKREGDIFLGWSDRPWVLDGASVRVSMIGFDTGEEAERQLDGEQVGAINVDLTANLDLTVAGPLQENADLGFQGPVKVGPFEITREQALEMLADRGNPNSRSNSDVIRPWINASDLTKRERGLWIIDFGESSLEDAAGYEKPFEYVRDKVKPLRDANRDRQRREKWWRLGRSGCDLRQAVSGIDRFIATPRVAKHRLFQWVPSTTLPDTRVVAIAREDDYFFGVLHSRVHEVWALARSARHGVGNDPTYNSTTCFETFPFPWPPGEEPVDDPCVQAIATAAKDLVEKRDRWLNPEGASEADLKKRTLTNLYNQRPTWLDLAHRTLDEAVLDAYGWPHDLSDDEILERLLTLNLKRAAKQEAT